jgi:thioesterase domain-containing protein
LSLPLSNRHPSKGGSNKHATRFAASQQPSAATGSLFDEIDAQSVCARTYGLHHHRACHTTKMGNLDKLCAELYSTWHAEIPLAAAMGVEVVTFAGDELTVRAPLAPNTNVHGTAFAGSLFSICVLTCWGRVWLALRKRGLAGQIVVADSQIKYRKAVTSEILCRCTFDDRAEHANLGKLATSGRAVLQLTCTIDGLDAPAVTFEGKYVVLPHK